MPNYSSEESGAAAAAAAANKKKVATDMCQRFYAEICDLKQILAQSQAELALLRDYPSANSGTANLVVNTGVTGVGNPGDIVVVNPSDSNDAIALAKQLRSEICKLQRGIGNSQADIASFRVWNFPLE